MSEVQSKEVLKIQLTRPALERLIGDNPEIELSLRSQIVEEFTKRHIKAFMNDEAFKAVYTAWQDEIHQECRAAMEVWRKQFSDKAADTNPSGVPAQHIFDLKRLLCETAKQQVANAIRDAIDEQSKKLPDLVTQAVEYAMKRRVNKEVEERFSAKLKEIQTIVTKED